MLPLFWCPPGSSAHLFICAIDLADTNTVAKLALAFGVEAATLLGETSSNSVPVADWSTKAAGLYVPFEPTVPGHPEMIGGYHPEYR